MNRDEVQDVTLALDDVNIEVEEGQFIAVLGHNGSGKSTFAKHLNALLTPSEGTVWVDGKTRQRMKIFWISARKPV